jgi:DNA-binding transcriptional LysR family regulator
VEISAVSRAVRDIEEALGLALFERLPRGVRLTAAGEAYVDAARDILARLGRAESEARSAANGTGALSLGCEWSFCCSQKLDLLRHLVRRNPNIVLTLVEDGPAALIARVRAGDLHVALTASDPVDHLQEQNDLETATLWRERLAVAVPEGEMTAELTWTDLAGRLLLCRPQDDWRRLVAQVEQLGGPTLQFMEHDVSGEGLLALVAVGLGWSIVPAGLPSPSQATVRFIPLAGAGAELDIQAVWRRSVTNPALGRFRELCREIYADVPSRSLGQSP